MAEVISSLTATVENLLATVYHTLTLLLSTVTTTLSKLLVAFALVPPRLPTTRARPAVVTRAAPHRPGPGAALAPAVR